MSPVQIDIRHTVLTVAGGKALARVVAKSIGRAAQAGARAQGGRHFWADVAKSVNAQSPDDTPEGALVGATHVAGAHKQHGGTISAPGRGAGSRQRDFLTIPVGKARDKRWSVEDARVKGGYTLFRVKAKSGKALIFGYRARLKRRQVELLFILKKSVWQRAYPWWPEGAVLSDAVAAGIRAHRALTGGAS
jgi:phage gpG-like protein